MSSMKKVKYTVKGMTCAACVAHVERAAYSVIKDKNSVTVSLLAGTITLILQENENEAALFTKLKKALSRAGYGLERGNDQNAAALDAVCKHQLDLRVNILNTLFDDKLSARNALSYAS